MKASDTQNHSLKVLLNISGLRQDHVAKIMQVTPQYLSMILNEKRKAVKKKKEIINYLIEVNNAHNSLTKNIAA